MSNRSASVAQMVAAASSQAAANTLLKSLEKMLFDHLVRDIEQRYGTQAAVLFKLSDGNIDPRNTGDQ